MSNNLNLDQVASNQTQKEVTINDATAQLDAAITEQYSANLTSGNLTLTSAQFRGAVLFITTGNSVSRDLTFPAIKRSLFAIKNGGSATLNIKVGSTTLTLGAGLYSFYQTDGTTNGIAVFNLGSGAAVTDLTQNLNISGVTSPSQITSNQNDYNPTNLSVSSVLRINSDAAGRTLTGLQGGAAGRVMVLQNIGSFPILLAKESASSSAANRFTLSSTLRLDVGQSVILHYDATTSRWRPWETPPQIYLPMSFWIQGTMANSEKVVSIYCTSDFKLESGATGWGATSDVASVGNVAFDIKKNGSSIGTITFNITSTGAFTFSSDVTFTAGDIFEIIAPATADANLAGVRITINKIRN